jgi:hypothetical protein
MNDSHFINDAYQATPTRDKITRLQEIFVRRASRFKPTLSLSFSRYEESLEDRSHPTPLKTLVAFEPLEV